MLAFLTLNAQTANNTELLGHIDPIPNGSTKHYSDIWGYTDPNGGEYALIDGYSGVYIINITDASNPVVVTFINGPSSIWRDIKVYDHYAYFVSENGNSGIQIVDLSGLPNTANLVNTFNSKFSTAHNIFIDGGFAYVIGSDNGNGMHIFDLADPVNPVETAYYSQSGYIHDVYVWDDTVVACAADSYDLVDVTDKSNPFKISESETIPGIYAHSGWMTEDKRYFYAAEEANVKDIIVYDLVDRNNWNVVIPSLQLPNDAIMHNIFIKGNYAYCSYYEAGLVVYDVSDPVHPIFAGQYDTYPTDNDAYNGVWGAFPFFPSGNVIISDQDNGLYIVKFLAGDTSPVITYTSNGSYAVGVENQNVTAQIFDNSLITDAMLYYKTTKSGVTSDWNFVQDLDGPDMNSNYEFEVPGQSEGTKVEFYFAAADDSGNVITSPIGGSGINPTGNIPPDNFYDYLVLTSVPEIINVSPDISDTTIVKGDYIPFHAEGLDTSGLDVTMRWYKNGIFKIQRSDYTFTSGFATDLPRVDTVTVVANNGYLSSERTWLVQIVLTTSVDDISEISDFKLFQNYPNPFNPSTVISYQLSSAGFVTLKVYDFLGREVKTLVSREQSVGNYTVNFSVSDLPADRQGLASGIYLYKLSVSGRFIQTKKMILLK